LRRAIFGDPSMRRYSDRTGLLSRSSTCRFSHNARTRQRQNHDSPSRAATCWCPERA
jgi:hypothetical protein